MRIRVTTLCCAGLIAAASTAGAQRCTPPEHPAFEFQVDQPAEYLVDTSAIVRPAPQRFVNTGREPGVLLVQLVVDTLGVPEPGTLHVLRMPSRAAADSVRLAASSWRFTPAVQGGCKVSQIVQTAVLH